jgi:hypothetical protein
MKASGGTMQDARHWRVIATGGLLLALACGGDDGGAAETDATGGSSSDDTADAGSSEGSGGSSSTGMPEPPPPGLECTEPFTYQGLDGCVATVEGIQIKFFPLPPGEPVEHLAVYFHGDTAPEWYDNWAFPTIVSWAEPRNILTLAVLSPVIGDSGLPEWGHAQPPDADAVATAIEAFADAHGAPHQEIFYWSTSGGSWFFTSSYIPVAAGRLPGWFAINCGGSGFTNQFAWDQSNATLRDQVAVFLNYGSLDFLADLADQSFQQYQGMGFSIDRLIHEGAMHCDHPIDQPTLDFWTQFAE